MRNEKERGCKVKRFFRKGFQSFGFAVICFLLAVCPVLSGNVKAAEQGSGISLELSSGFQGYVKQNEWYPVRLTLTNNTAQDLKGELVITNQSSRNGMTVDTVIPAELPRGAAIQLTASIPGDVLNKDNNSIHFYKDSFKSGKTIPIIGTSYIDVRATSSYTIGVISRDPDTLNFMPSLNQRGYDITVIPVSEKDLPDDPILLNTLRVLVINDVATADWSQRKIIAIQNWVKLGGTLILSGGAGYGKTAEAFKAIAPLEAAGMSSLTSADSLKGYGGTELKLDAPVAIATGKVTDGIVEQSEGGQALTVSRKLGSGSVLSVAFDPSLAPFATWSGSAMLWAKLLQNSLSPIQAVTSTQATNDMYWSMDSIINEFPSIKPPNFMFLMFMFIGYMIVVAPILYILLAKADRREWSWWLIPLLSVVTGFVLFFFGAEDKRNMSAHTVEIVELVGQGDAIRSGATAVFIPTGGTVKAEFDEKVSVIPYANQFQNGNLALDGKTQVISIDKKTEALWRSVPYWSTRKLWIDRRVMGEAGQIKLSYRRNSNDIEVTATNETKSDLTHVALLISGQAQLIGDLKRGESGKATISINNGNVSGYYSYGSSIFPNSSYRSKDEFRRERQLLDNFINRRNGGFSAPDSLVIGFSTDHEQNYKVNGSGVKSDNLKMWVQKLNGAFVDGDRAIVPAGHIKPIITENKVNRMDNYGDGMYSFGEGEVVFEYMLSDNEEIAYDKLEIILNNGAIGSNLFLSVWNEAEGDWTDSVDVAADPNEYIINHQLLRMKYTIKGSADTALPLIALEGEVKSR